MRGSEENKEKTQPESKHKSRCDFFPELLKKTFQMSTMIFYFLFIDSLNAAPGAKSTNVIHALTTKRLLEKDIITSAVFIEQEIKEIFLALDPRTEVQNKASARAIHQLSVKHFPCMAPSSSTEIIGSVLTEGRREPGESSLKLCFM